MNLGEAELLPPVEIGDPECVAYCGCSLNWALLVFEANELPELARVRATNWCRFHQHFKGRTPGYRYHCVAAASFFTSHCRQASLTLSPSDLDNFVGERARRGKLLPRGFQRVERLEANREIIVVR